MVQNLDQEATKRTERPSDWIERHFYVPDPRDPITGNSLPPGPIRLADHQRRIINAALEKDERGFFKYSTIIYSAPKKSGKSALSSAVVLYIAYHHPNGFAACLANDGTQATDRLYGPIYANFRLHRQFGGIFKNIEPNLGEVTLANFTKIRAVPCDAAGEAGAQPIISAWSEIWGFDTERKRRLFTEMTIPPTLYGKAIRWIETYAGFTGKSELLEQLYDLGIRRGEPHPAFSDLVGQDGPVVKTNDRAGIFVYWDTEPRMPWQSEEFYTREAAILPPSEFQRVHRNQWVSPAGAFIEDGWWDACEVDSLPALAAGNRTPVVVGIDMAVTRDCAALVAVTRDPVFPATDIAIRAVRIFSPARTGGIIDQEKLVRPVIEAWHDQWNVVCWAYDPYQMAKLAQDMMREGYGWFKPFGQTQPRNFSDKQLHDMIMHRQIKWGRNSTVGDVGSRGTSGETLYNHIVHAGSTTDGGRYRIAKLANQLKIDGAVALSQAVYMCMSLNLGNKEQDTESLIRQLRDGKISLEEFARQSQGAYYGR